MAPQNDEIEIDLRELFFLLWKKVYLLLAVTVVGGLLFGIYSYYFVTPLYQSTSKLYIVNSSTEAMLSLTDLQIGTNLTKDYPILIKSRPVVEQVAENLKLDMKYNELVGIVAVDYEDGTRIVNISITHPDKTLSMEIANEFALVAQKHIPEIMKTSEPSIVENAVEGQKVSPHNFRNTLIGAMLGFVLCAGIIIILYVMDDSIKTVEDIEKYLDLNTLAAIPAEGGTNNSEKKNFRKKLGARKGGRN